MFVVTGGAGFIGSCVLARLNAVGHKDVIVVDHLDDDLKKKNLAGKKYREFIDKQDFLKLVLQKKLDAGLDVIIHMGACSSTTLTDAKYFEENNYEYTLHLAQWSLANKKRFIYASSAATYGDGALGYSDDDTTTRKLKPLNLYGLSKQKFDLWVLRTRVQNAMVGLKFFNVFGPNEYHKEDMRSVVAKSYPKVVKEGKIRLFRSCRPDFADGEQKRDFIYIKDALDVMMFFVENPKVNGIYNLGTRKARSWNDVARALLGALKKTPVIEYFDMPPQLRDKYQYFTQADMAKIRQAGYKKNFSSLEDSVTDYVTYLENMSYL